MKEPREPAMPTENLEGEETPLDNMTEEEIEAAIKKDSELAGMSDTNESSEPEEEPETPSGSYAEGLAGRVIRIHPHLTEEEAEEMIDCLI